MSFKNNEATAKNSASSKNANNSTKHVPLHDRAVKSLASTIYAQLKSEGCEHRDIIGVSSQLISIVTSQIKEDSNN